MTTLPIATLTHSIVDLLKEAYDGPPDANSPTWFNDNDPNAGIFGQIKPITAVQASKSADGTGNPGTTVASHVEHLRWSLANANSALRGETYQANWKASWTVTVVDEGEWNRLRDQLRDEYQTISKAIAKQETLESDYLNGVLALIPHAAYHLATIRQIIERIQKS
ncbi:MAG: hypothetical protein ACYC6H_05320 [Bellilinea sp.]